MKNKITIISVFIMIVSGCGCIWYMANRPYSSQEVYEAQKKLSQKTCSEVLIEMGAENDRILGRLLGASHSTLQRIRKGESLPTMKMQNAIYGTAFHWEILRHNWLLLSIKYCRCPLDLWVISLNPTLERPLPE